MQVANCIFVGLTVLFFGISNLFAILSGTLDFVALGILISAAIYLVFLILSFTRCNLDNKSFKSAFYLNLVWVVLVILSITIIPVYFYSVSPALASSNLTGIGNRINALSSILNVIVAISYFASFLVFLVGYYKNKK